MAEWQRQILADLLEKQGLQSAPSQVWQGIRLVPLIDPQPVSDLRLFREKTEATLGIVNVDDDLAYYSYLPHSYILRWSPEGAPLAMRETQIELQNKQRKADGKHWKVAPVVEFERMAKKQDTQHLRFLPQHLGIEGYLHQFFRAPGLDWRDTYRRSAISEGLLPRTAFCLSGYALAGFEEALRLFEIHENQVGCLVFVADDLAMMCLYPHPDDYHFLHRSLLGDLFAEHFWYYSRIPVAVQALKSEGDSQALNWGDLKRELQALRSGIVDFQAWMASGLLKHPISSQMVQTLGPYQLRRFVSEIAPHETQEAHMGELILSQQGKCVYFKSLRLSPQQIQTTWLLQNLEKQLWHLGQTAQALNISYDQLVLKMLKAGLGQILKPQIIDQVLKRQREENT